DLDGNGLADLVIGMDNGGPGVTANEVYVLLTSGLRGVESFGVGTSGCFGPVRLFATAPATVGNQTFAFVSDSAPPGGFGYLLVAGVAARVNAGVDPFGIGLVFHLDVANQPLFQITPIAADSAGVCVLPSAVGNVPSLAGFRFECQALWYFGACLPASLGYASSNGLEVRILP
ncbi:MAG: hypothetical protein KDB53_20945, partial [Planctomycetes bacterium]|nr:hypothetical protein [Planctomycetota bacterium]